MKILDSYYTGKGNTEKIAKTIKEGLTSHQVETFLVNEVNPADLGS